jgi:S1-C subfamily serine protease
VLLALPLLATAGPASAAVKSSQSRPAAAPSSNGLIVLADLLARLFPAQTTSPSGAHALAPQITASTVRVSSVACGLRLRGSGFSPAPDTIVTNAHVVAGSTSAEILRPDGRAIRATVQVFDPGRDLAVLHVPGLGQQPLGLAPAVTGEFGAVFGHPGGQAAVEVSPAQVVRRVTTDIGDIYGNASTPRQILVLHSDLAPGDSGGPMVNSAGKVTGVAFAVANLRRSTAFAIASEEVVPVLAQPWSGPVSTGPCLA